MPELVLFRRGEEVLWVALERPRLVLGHTEDCDIVIPDPYVSRQHVALLRDGARCLLEDLSGQGTVVAGQPMQLELHQRNVPHKDRAAKELGLARSSLFKRLKHWGLSPKED